MATLGSVAAIAVAASSGGNKEPGPKIEASSSDEEKFIKYVDD